MAAPSFCLSLTQRPIQRILGVSIKQTSPSMILFRTFSGNITSSELTIFTLFGSNANGVTIALENRDELNYISYRFQGASVNTDGSFSDLEDTDGNLGVSGILAPGAQIMVKLANTDSYTRLLASSSGGARLDAGIQQFFPNGSTNFTNGQL